MIFQDELSLKTRLRGVIEKTGDNPPYVVAASNFRGSLSYDLAETGVFAIDPQVRTRARLAIKDAAFALGVLPASIHPLYSAIGRGETGGFTVPAVNIRGLTFDMARALFRAAIRKECGAFIFEIARSEMGYTSQRPGEYVAVVLAAALHEGYRGPVFIQGDHFQVSAKGYAASPEEEVQELRELCREAVQAGFYNIDIDSSTLVDLKRDTLGEQQRDNAAVCAELTRFIRENEPGGTTVSVGGEIGEIGGLNSTVEEFTAFMEEYLAALGGGEPIKKIAVQTGTSHGGVVLPDGAIGSVKLDFNVLSSISEVAKSRYAMGGTVQHGASTLPDDAFHHLPSHGACEVHLATGFQNMIFNHPALPRDFKASVYDYLEERYGGDRKEGQTREQFFYKTRKKGFGGKLKREWWNLPKETRAVLRRSLEDKFAFLMDQLKVTGSLELVNRFVKAAPPR